MFKARRQTKPGLAANWLRLLLTGLILLFIFTYSQMTGDSLDEQLPTSTWQEGQLQAHFIDVGQGDSIFIKLPHGGNMLIDAGDNSSGKKVKDYLKRQGVSEIDYLVATHPHADHIGGLDEVIREFSVKKFYMPKVSHTTKSFTDVLTAAKAKGIQVFQAKAGVEVYSQDNIHVNMLAPNSNKYESLNNYSAVINVIYGRTAFLLTGDAEELSEKEIINTKADIRADVLKIGHHGSSSSTTQEFLDRVNPAYAVIMVGEKNDYGHPHRETLAKLEKKGIKVLRTDRQGDIVFVSDGEKLKVVSKND